MSDVPNVNELVAPKPDDSEEVKQLREALSISIRAAGILVHQNNLLKTTLAAIRGPMETLH